MGAKEREEMASEGELDSATEELAENFPSQWNVLEIFTLRHDAVCGD